jgi:hypothetical protein
MGCSPTLFVGRGTLHLKNQRFTKCYKRPRKSTNPLERPEQQEIDMRNGTWNMTSLYRRGSHWTVARESEKQSVDLAGLHEVWSDKRGTAGAKESTG